VSCSVCHVCRVVCARYQSREDVDYVDYLQFSDEVESIFTTKDLEKMPLLEVTQFKPPVEWELISLDPDAEGKFKACMLRLTEKVSR
jgi:hypothetical protein